MDDALRSLEGAFVVRSSEVNRYGQARIETFFDYFQEMAGAHADKLGCGLRMLQEHQQAWVLLRVRLDVFRTPRLGDTVRVRTWPSGFKRLYALREGLFFDNDGEIGHITSYWALLDVTRMRPLRLPEALAVPLPDNSSLPQYFDLDSKVMAKGHDLPMTCVVPEHFIDINGHTNNARYASLVGDWLAKNSGEPQEITSITAHFLQGTPAWSNITISGHCADDGHFSVEIVKDGTEPVAVYVAEGNYKSNGEFKCSR